MPDNTARADKCTAVFEPMSSTVRVGIQLGAVTHLGCTYTKSTHILDWWFVDQVSTPHSYFPNF